MAVKSYGFAIGNLRAKENTLLKTADFLQLSSAKNLENLKLMLCDKGYGIQSDSMDIPQILSAETTKLWNYITETAPEMSAFEPFIYENDFHNYKAVLKSIIHGTDYANLLILPSLINSEALEKSVKEKRFDLLPEYISRSAEEAYTVLVSDRDIQLCDSIIDAGCMNAQLKKAKEIKNATVLKLTSTLVFYNNMKAALRASKAGKSSVFLNYAVTENGIISKRKIVEAALSGEKKLLELMSSANTVYGKEASEHYLISAGSFEKFCDDIIISEAKSCKYINFGIEPLIGFMLAKKTEIKNLRIIYSGVKTGQSEESIKGRLRELYD